MARWCLESRVFVGPPDRISGLRGLAIQSIKDITSDSRFSHLRFVPFDYHSVPGGPGHAQALILDGLRSSDSVALLFDCVKSFATELEFQSAITEHLRGRLPNLTVYFKDDEGGPLEDDFRKHVGTQVLYRRFSTEEELRQAIRADWTPRATDLDDAADCLLRAEQPITDLMQATMVLTPTATDGICALSQLPAEEIALRGETVHSRYARQGSSLSAEDAYLISRFLDRAIERGNPEPMAPRAFPNEVHQCLSYRIREELDLANRVQRISQLQKWLGSTAKVPPTARNFAAFELGMCKAGAAIFDLRSAMMRPTETAEVRCYAALALGMIRRIDSIRPLIECYRNSAQPERLRMCALTAIAGILAATDDPAAL